MNARALVAFVVGSGLAGAGCRSDEVAERWQEIQRERELGERPASVRREEDPNVRAASLLLGNMERQIERTASLGGLHATLRSVEVELLGLRERAPTDDGDEPAHDDESAAAEEQGEDGATSDERALVLAAIDRRRLELRRELERADYVSDDDWPAYTARLDTLAGELRDDVGSFTRRTEAVGTT